MLVKEVMSEKTSTISPDALLVSAARKMRDEDIGSLLVMDEDKLTGIVTDRDITCRGLVSGLDQREAHVSDAMSRDIIWCKPNEDVADAARLMEEHKIRRLPVVDDNGKLAGMLSVGDISTHLPHELSGEIMAEVCKPEASKKNRKITE